MAENLVHVRPTRQRLPGRIPRPVAWDSWDAVTGHVVGKRGGSSEAFSSTSVARRDALWGGWVARATTLPEQARLERIAEL